MKTLVILFALVLSGCASLEYEQYSRAQTYIATARHQAEAARYRALSDIAATGDSSAKVAAVMALALGANTAQQPVIQAPQPNQALQWAQILVPGLTQVAGMRYNYLSQQVQSNNATTLGLSTNNAFVGLAGKIQAPGSTFTSTTTLSGTGNLGSGTYSTTDRNDVTTLSPVTVIPPVTIVPPVLQPVFHPTTP